MKSIKIQTVGSYHQIINCVTHQNIFDRETYPVQLKAVIL